MVKRFGLLALSLCLIAFGSKAVTLANMGLIVPYEIICEKQSDGTEQIRMRILLRTTKKQLKGPDGTVTEFDGLDTSTFILQSKDSCTVLDAMYAANHKLYGFDAIQVGQDRVAPYIIENKNGIFSLEGGTLCVFLMNVRACCKDIRETVSDFVLLEDADQVKWVDVGTITNVGTQSDVLSEPPYSSDALLGFTIFPVDTSNSTSIRTKILSTAVLNLHGKTCCFETFGLKPEDAKGVLLQIIKHLMNGVDGSFTATGTFGSCGDTGAVTVTGNRTVQRRVTICGTEYCLTDLPTVDFTGDNFVNLGAFTTGNASRCFTKFLGQYINQGYSPNRNYDPLFGTFGLQDEICRLIDGRDLKVKIGDGGFGDFNQQLHLLCLGDDTYGFAVTEVKEDGIQTALLILGCRFKLEECKKCCK